MYLHPHKVILYQKPVLNDDFNYFWYTKTNQIWIVNSDNKYTFEIKTPPSTQHEFLTIISINFLHQTKSESKIYIFKIDGRTARNLQGQITLIKDPKIDSKKH